MVTPLRRYLGAISFLGLWLFMAVTASATIRLNEVMASNHETLADEDGNFSDWLEVYNTGTVAVNLAGWGLSNDASLPFRWLFPALVLQPQKCLLIWASKKDRRVFSIMGEELIMIEKHSYWRYWDNGTTPVGIWQGLAYDDGAWLTGRARFGYPAETGGTPLARSGEGRFFPAYFFRHVFSLAQVPLAETVGVLNIQHHFDDGAVVWINGVEVYRYKMPTGEVNYEAYTGDGYNVDYQGSWLTNALNKSLALSLLQPGSNVCAVSLHQSKLTTSDALFDMGLYFQPGTNSMLHTNFKISASGCDLYLTRPDSTIADHVIVPVMPSDMALGRMVDGTGVWRVLKRPTPGTSNDSTISYQGASALVEASIEPGFYSNNVTVALSTTTPDAAIYYTLDGSTPSANSLLYTQPLILHNRSTNANVLSLINTGEMYATPAGLQPKANVVRAVACKPDWIDSPLFGGTWLIGAQTAQFTLPVFSLTANYNQIFGASGLYGNPNTAHNNDWEYPFNVELFVAEARMAGQVMGVRIHGGYSRNMAQKTLRLYARSEYGSSHFDYPLFPDQPQYTSYKRFLLRNSGNDWAKSMMRDALAQELSRHLRHDTQAYQPSVVFLNGEYWGMHNARERYDNKYLNRVYGVDEESVDLLLYPHNGSSATAQEGSAQDFNAMIAWLNGRTLTDAANFAVITNQVDEANFIDYMLANMFVVNKDWPGNNIKFWRVRQPATGPEVPYGHDGRWRWLMYDVDFAFAGWDPDPPSEDMWAWVTKTDGSGRVYESATRLFRKMYENSGFKTRLLLRYSNLLNSAFLPARTQQVAEQMRAVMAPEMPRHIARWPGAISSMQAWSNQVTGVVNYMRDRHAWEWKTLCTKFGVTTGELCVAVSDFSQGFVKINDMPIDENTCGVTNPAAPYPWRGYYLRELPLEVRALPRAGYRFVGWLESGSTQNVSTVAWKPSETAQTLTALFELDPAAHQEVALFLPVDEANWDKAANWSTGVVPDWPGAKVEIPPPTELDDSGLPRRNVRLATSAITVGSVKVDNGVFSNRIRNKKGAPSGCSLTFDGNTTNATLMVVGDEVGFTAVEVDEGVVLATDLLLDVCNKLGDDEYGALRLQAGWSGAGGLIKDGPGLCTMTGEGKSYLGTTRIYAGVLSITQPATPTASAGVVVEDGGQLRLTSGAAPGEPLKVYAFGGTVVVASMGRADMEGVAGAGAKGGLRYDAGGSGNSAELATPVQVAGAACIHVEGSGGTGGPANTLTLSGGVTGAGALVKSGGGWLIVAADADDFEGLVIVSNGLFQVDAPLREAEIILADESAWLSGTGSVGVISGNGVVSPGGSDIGHLRARRVSGETQFAFQFTTVGSDYCGNDLLELTYGEGGFEVALASSSCVDVYLSRLLQEGEYCLGGFATVSEHDFIAMVAGAQWRFYVADESGTIEFGAHNFSLCEVALDIESVACTDKRILKISRPAGGYAAWRADWFSLAERTDPLISGPLSVGFGETANLLRYALGAGRFERMAPLLPHLTRTPVGLAYAFRRRRDDTNLIYTVITSDDLNKQMLQWQDIFEVVGLVAAAQVTNEPEEFMELVTIPIAEQAGGTNRFFRLRVRQAE